MKRISDEVVYSTDRTVSPPCKRCGRRECVCGKPTAGGLNQPLKILLERKGRGGKAVTLVQGLDLPASKAEELLRSLKKACGTGGTLKEGCIEIQGDARDRVEELLRTSGFKTKRAGG